MQRRVLGEGWKVATERAVSDGESSRVVKIEERPDEVFVLYAGPEAGRAEALQLRAAVAKEHFGVKTGVAFGVGPANGQPSSMQMVELEADYDQETRRKLLEVGRRMFGVRRHTRSFEYAPTEQVYVNRFAGKSNAATQQAGKDQKSGGRKVKNGSKRYGRNKRRRR